MYSILRLIHSILERLIAVTGQLTEISGKRPGFQKLLNLQCVLNKRRTTNERVIPFQMIRHTALGGYGSQCLVFKVLPSALSVPR